MISALRKIEGRGELPGATSAVMEMCVDNPREGFGELFDTHPTVDSRVAALVKFAGGHDPGPIALPPPGSDVTDDRSGGGRPIERPMGGAGKCAGRWPAAHLRTVVGSGRRRHRRNRTQSAVLVRKQSPALGDRIAATSRHRHGRNRP